MRYIIKRPEGFVSPASLNSPPPMAADCCAQQTLKMPPHLVDATTPPLLSRQLYVEFVSQEVSKFDYILWVQ